MFTGCENIRPCANIRARTTSSVLITNLIPSNYVFLHINTSYIIENSLQLLHPGAMFRYVAFRSCKDVKRSATGSLVTIVRASGPCHVKTFLDATDGHTTKHHY